MMNIEKLICVRLGRDENEKQDTFIVKYDNILLGDKYLSASKIIHEGNIICIWYSGWCVVFAAQYPDLGQASSLRIFDSIFSAILKSGSAFGP